MKFLIQILTILVITATISICAIKPEMHKTVLVYNSDYKLVPAQEVEVQKNEIPVAEMQVTQTPETVKKVTQTVSTPKVTKVTQTTAKKAETKTAAQPVVKTQTKTVVQPVTKTQVKTVTPAKSATTTVTAPQPVQKTVQTSTQSVPKVLTQKEEEIAWNVWRSNLQNSIMRDVRLPALPTGIVFRYSFTVDKYGKISNIYTYSENPSYTPYAIQYIAPVIRSYQGKSILNFPEGSARTVTEFKGGWKISSSERLSTPKDYNDYEKVVKY